MALDKKTIAPGTVIRVKSLKGNTAGIAFGPNDNWMLLGISVRDCNGTSKTVVAQIGDTLTVVKGPRRVHGINYCRVETVAGDQGEVFWTELRGNCEVV